MIGQLALKEEINIELRWEVAQTPPLEIFWSRGYHNLTKNKIK